MSAARAPVPSAPEETVLQQSIFEGMFVHALQPDAAFAAELKAAGFDLARQQPTYPASVWRACLAVACRHACPGLDEAAARRKLSGLFLDGFFRTITGRMVAAILPLIGPEALLKRLPRFFSMGTKGTALTVQPAGERHWRVEVHDAHPVPDFTAGLVAAALERTRVTPTVDVTVRSPHDYVLDVRW